MRVFLIIILYLPFFVFSQVDYKVTLDQGLPTLSMRVESVPEDLDSYLDLFMVLGDDNYSPSQVSGKYWVEIDWINFRPLKPLQGGKKFEARFNFPEDTVRIKFEIPEPAVPKVDSSSVVHVYPIDNEIPSNILFFHTRFTEPMQENDAAYEYVKLIKNDTIQDLTWRHKAFWLDKGRVLVLMVHPGRVKRGIDYLPELGELFTVGETIEIEVGVDLKDALGRPIKESYRKEFKVVGPDREIPKILFDEFVLPNDDVPFLDIAFSEKMNYASIIDGVMIYNEKGELIEGEIRELSDERFTFTPYSLAWPYGKYKIVFSKIVADLANNRLNRPFEIEDVNDKLKDVPVEWWFTID